MTPLPGDGEPEIDLYTDRPHSARVYDYLLGGKDNFAPDRAAGDASVRAWPSLPTSMKQTRVFMHRVTRTLAREYGVRQFLDIGTGIPTPPNLHEVAQDVAPECRVVYVDNDPIVLAHARALLQSTEEGRTGYIQADLRDPESILGDPQLREVLDLDRPVALSLIAIVHFILDEHDPQGIVARLMRALAPGSFLALTVFTGDTDPERVAGVGREYNERGIPLQIRDRAEAERFFAGLEPIDPGVTLVHHWRPDGIGESVPNSHIAMYGGVARKPA
ncbi:SAM-dependent methyltransferase [Streptomyces sp. WMMC500]|uniref:SAM-dependent methyltransferase n=1 Tax=Streptomyces sp. WMMC500 TaxID=3015154 RepID=UPI00248CEF4D|nr:SAM-dependent methyltransferase [Streptomyces sp. WMMC500]WBB62305.1 SAM-dependent methyltransferase [Streptomyces sp. WMMC500]